MLALLTLYANSHGDVLELVRGAALCVVPYILCRVSLAVSLAVYSLYIPEHRPQMRLYACFIVFTCLLWIPVIFIGTRAKIGLLIVVMVLEQVLFLVAYHPRTKKMMKLTMSTALNIEHEVERFGTFVTIAIGEFLYKIVASHPLGVGFSDKFGRGIFLLVIAYVLFWIYVNNSTTRRATHALRRSGATAILWIYAHVPLVAALVLAADAGGEITALDVTRLSKPRHELAAGLHERAEEEINMYALSLFFTGSLCVALVCLHVIGVLDKPQDPADMFVLRRFWRVALRAPIGVIILCLSFAEMNSTVMMGVITVLLLVLLVFESITSTPRACLQFLQPSALETSVN